MWRLVVFGLAVAVAACTESNPRSCRDGLCTDQRFPFCDLDGSLEGHPLTCIAVACTAGEFVACRGDQAITCNSAGNDHELLQCELGCAEEAAGCKSCTGNQNCANPSPVCELTTSTCRQCTLDDECSSRVCNLDTGACLAESAVIYAAADGTGLCSITQPCSLTTAIQLAAQTAPAPTLRMLPGVYTTSFSMASTNTLNVVATGAILSPATTAIEISGGAVVTMRGLTVVHARAATCKSTAGPVPSLLLRDVSITALGDGNATLFEVERCKVQVFASELSLASTEVAFFLTDDAALELDRVHLHGNLLYHLIANYGARNTINVTNSLLEDVRFAMQPLDTGPPGTRLTVASSTIANRSMNLDCEVIAPSYVARYENTIAAPLGAFDAVRGTNCTFSNTLLSVQAAPLPGTVVADPQFVDVGARNYHLKATSPAVDMAVPSLFGLALSPDLDGTARPQGPKPDIGAYELKQ